ncbi:hypothetical protein Scep_021328 [Stephania cephalantha]|uniref:Uncharacterized protein n=1 Tax=Stephania cephalantha TaxID=152367 RepID=A0AAP0FDB2_9MAGN
MPLLTHLSLTAAPHSPPFHRRSSLPSSHRRLLLSPPAPLSSTAGSSVFYRRLLRPFTAGSSLLSPPSPPSSHSQPLLTHLPLTAAPHSRPLNAGSSSHRRLSFHSRTAGHLSSTLTTAVGPSRSDVSHCSRTAALHPPHSGSHRRRRIHRHRRRLPPREPLLRAPPPRTAIVAENNPLQFVKVDVGPSSCSKPGKEKISDFL